MVIAYLSVGTDRLHLDVQREVITEFLISKDNMQVEKWIIDVTGEKAKEMGQNLKVVFERVKDGDVLIVSDITRLSRSLFEMMEILSLCLKKKVALWCVEDRYVFDYSMNSDKMCEAFKLTDSIDHSLITMRTKDSLIELQKAGKKLGRPKGTYAIQQSLYERKEDIISMLERGESVKSVCEYFNVSKNTFYKFKRNYGLA